MVDFGSHRKFMLRCLRTGVTPVNKVHENNQNIRKAERQLLNECVRYINNTIKLGSLKRDTCINQLARIGWGYI